MQPLLRRGVAHRGGRHLLAIENGVDQFGGNSDIRPILEAYRLGCEKSGEPAMRARMERSAVRLLRTSSGAACLRTPTSTPLEDNAVKWAVRSSPARI
ncbi:MAG: hypothetical protein V8Q30_04990 [Acutalibacteraceae bacterium]